MDKLNNCLHKKDKFLPKKEKQIKHFIGWIPKAFLPMITNERTELHDIFFD